MKKILLTLIMVVTISQAYTVVNTNYYDRDYRGDQILGALVGGVIIGAILSQPTHYRQDIYYVPRWRHIRYRYYQREFIPERRRYR